MSSTSDISTIPNTNIPKQNSVYVPPGTGFGFIILRHVNNEISSHYWSDCYDHIRHFYPEIPVVIIDDNSSYEFIDSKKEAALYKCLVLRSIFPKRGELLPYYYYIHNHWFDSALVIHDSVFINVFIDFERLSSDLPEGMECKFLWHFDYLYNDRAHESALINRLRNAQQLLTVYNDSNAWRGCFGVMSIIQRRFLLHLETRYGITDMISHVTSRSWRMALERAFACMVYDTIKTVSESKTKSKSEKHEMDKNKIVISCLGNIHKYCKWGYSYGSYLRNDYKYAELLPVVKVWSGR
jgi:hypothetical protein